MVKSARDRHRNRTGSASGQPSSFHSIIMKTKSAFKRALKKKDIALQESLISDIEHIALVVSGDLLHLITSDILLNQSFGKDYALITQILKTAQLRHNDKAGQKTAL